MENWLKNRLSKCLKFKIPDDMISYVLTLGTAEEIDQHFATLLNYNIKEHRTFVNEFIQRKFNKFKNQEQTLLRTSNESNKKYDNQNDVVHTATKYTNSQRYDKMTSASNIPNRNHCDCQASKHKLINNCMKCGRIICELEGCGPCFFCGNLVFSKEEQKSIKDISQKDDNLINQLKYCEAKLAQSHLECFEETLAQNNLEHCEGILAQNYECEEALAQNNLECCEGILAQNNLECCEGILAQNYKCEEALAQNNLECCEESLAQNYSECDKTSENHREADLGKSVYIKRNSVKPSDPEKKKHERLEEKMKVKKHVNRILKKITIDFTGKEIECPIITIEYKTDEIVQACTNDSS